MRNQQMYLFQIKLLLCEVSEFMPLFMLLEDIGLGPPAEAGMKIFEN